MAPKCFLTAYADMKADIKQNGYHHSSRNRLNLFKLGFEAGPYGPVCKTDALPLS